MRIRTYCFIIIPIVLLGCGTYHYLDTHKDHFQSSKLPENKAEMQKEVKKLDGRKK